MDPVIVQINPPKTPFHMPHLPSMGPRGTRILTVAAALVICASMLLFATMSVLVNQGSFVRQHSIHNIDVPAIASGTQLSSAASPGGGIAVGTGGTSGTNSPVVKLTATPASVAVGGSSVLKWSATNNPTSCSASGDWSGSRPASGSASTGSLNRVDTYIFTLTCKTKTGTGFSTVSVGSVARGGTGNIATRPSVKLAATPSSVYTNESATLSWAVTNNPTSCTASGDWSGARATTNSTWTVGPLSTAKTYTYTLTCQNGGGSGYATATVAATPPPPNLPLTSLYANPVGPVTPGTNVQLTWKTTNNPTSCTASGDWSGSKSPSGGSQGTGPLNDLRTYTFNLSCRNNAGSTNDSAAIVVLPAPPSVSLTVSPSTINVGDSATISWSATNNPTSCTASGDWSGSKAPNGGSQNTGVLNTARTYLYSLSCSNAGGTGYQNNVALTVGVPPAPAVTLTASPITTTTGKSATLTWSATNNPTSCTASGSWSGSKSASGTQSTGALNSVKTYTYKLACSNAGGTGQASASINVTSGGGTTSPPVVTVALNPTSIGAGSSSTISWSATNNPTSCTASGSWSGSKSASGSQSTGAMGSAGSYTYSLSCSNSAGSGSASATLTVKAVPVVSVTLSPVSITAGSSSTISWSATNSPSSCTAGGSWSGSKAASGSQSTGAMNTAGSFNFTLSCTNSGGTGSGSGTLVVNPAGTVYCGGLSPCHGSAYMANHASVGNCYAWNTGSGSAYPWIINITSFRPDHPGGTRTGSIEETTSVCNHNIHAILAGNAAIPGYKDSGGDTTYSHHSGTVNNTSSSNLSSYRVGYYDAADPN
ncbi:MAG TPA: hypothetical protein VFH39_05145 [Candidatus Saccharimonadales bacterium]|nr:hypothetical protein [Candidatus Saccharimonadales bacterium]